MSDARGSTGPGFWIGVAVGWSLVAFGTAGLLMRLGARGTFDVGVWVVGGNVAHDALVAPLAAVVAVAVAALVPRPWRAPLLAGLATSAVVVLVAVPVVGGFGRKPRNPSVLPLDYPIALATVLAVVWLLVGVWCALIWARRQRRGITAPTRSDPPTSP